MTNHPYTEIALLTAKLKAAELKISDMDVLLLDALDFLDAGKAYRKKFRKEIRELSDVIAHHLDVRNT